MKRPKVSDHFDKDEFGHIVSLDVDFASYQSALNEYIDFLEKKPKVEITKCTHCGGDLWYDYNCMYYVCHDCKLTN